MIRGNPVSAFETETKQQVIRGLPSRTPAVNQRTDDTLKPSLRTAFIAWLAISMIGTLLWASASEISTGTLPRAVEAGIKVTANVFDTAASPGWMIARFAGQGGRGIFTAALCHGFSWAAYIACIVLMQRLIAGRACMPQASPSTVPSPPVENPGRRRFLACTLVGVPIAASSTSLIYATAVGPWTLRLRRFTVPISGLPPELVGTRIALLTDTHLGRRIPRGHIERAVAMALDLSPEVFILGGDYVDHEVANIDPAMATFAPLVATGRPVIGVLGNHDYYADAERTLLAMEQHGIVPLRNERRFLVPGSPFTLSNALALNSAAVCIAGIEDLWEGKPDLEEALRSVPEHIPRLLISHNPDFAESEEAGAHRVDLMLSGHTHGGQVSLPFIGTPIVPSRYGSKYARGLAQAPHFPVIVSAGIGMAVAPVRLGVPPEVVEITLIARA